MQAKIQAQLISALDLLLDVVCVVDSSGRFVAVSAACEKVFGYTQDELIGQPVLNFVLPEDRARTLVAAGSVMVGKPLRNFENRYVHKAGHAVDIMWSANWSEADQLRVAVARDITLYKQSQSMQAMLHSISLSAHSARDIVDLCRGVHQIIESVLPLGGFSVALYDSANNEMLFPYSTGESLPTPVAGQLDPETLAGIVVQRGEMVLLAPDKYDEWPSELRHVECYRNGECLGAPLIVDQRILGALVVCSHAVNVQFTEQHKILLQFVATQIADNIERKQANARLRYMAQYDHLTKLPNRALFDDRLQMALTRMARTDEKLALLFIDLDDFKPVNDNYGHAVGDVLLQHVAGRIQGCVRESDTVSRIGGDEFVVLLSAIHTAQNAAQVAEHICAAIHVPLVVAGHTVQVSASVGVAIYLQHGQTQMQLMRKADAAMYVAKNSGGNQFRMAINNEASIAPAASATSL